MQTPPRITFRDMPSSPSVEAKITERVQELEQFHPRITSCHAVVEAHHRHQRKGKLYHVSLHIVVPGGEIAVRRDPAEHHAHEDVYVAIRDAFDAARRRLEDHARKQRGDVKQHETQPHGTVTEIFPDEGYGTIRSAIDGQDIYFHRNSVVGGDFAELSVGAQVRFALHEGEGRKGPQASTVMPVGKHHPVAPAP